jgi:hypothetical protein
MEVNEACRVLRTKIRCVLKNDERTKLDKSQDEEPISNPYWISFKCIKNLSFVHGRFNSLNWKTYVLGSHFVVIIIWIITRCSRGIICLMTLVIRNEGIIINIQIWGECAHERIDEVVAQIIKNNLDWKWMIRSWSSNQDWNWWD